MLALKPVSLREANEYVRQNHRHHKPVVGHKFSKGAVKVEHGYLDVNGWWKVYGTRTKHVTHWMPMPEQPKEG